MRIALIDGTKKHTYYPFGLLRIGAYLKNRGDEVKLFFCDLPNPKKESFDEYWISAIFTFEINHVKRLIRTYARYGTVRVGGVSPTLLPNAYKNEPCIIQTGKMQEAESFPLDYTLLGFEPEYSMSKITDGCIRKCPFCAVPKMETTYYERPVWKEDILKTTKRVVFSDNNYTNRAQEEMMKDIDYFNWMRENTKNRTIDFNQGIDCRLINPRLAELLSKMPISPLRFSWDGHQEDNHIQRAISLMAERGVKNFSIYMLYNFTDDIAYAYTRLKTLTKIAEKENVSIMTFPMRYQPIDQIDSDREYIGKKWDAQAKKNFMNALNHHSIGGGFSFSSVSELEAWLGEDEKEFNALMHYPKAAMLFARKKEALRKSRKEKVCGK